MEPSKGRELIRSLVLRSFGLIGPTYGVKQLDAVTLLLQFFCLQTAFLLPCEPVIQMPGLALNDAPTWRSSGPLAASVKMESLFFS